MPTGLSVYSVQLGKLFFNVLNELRRFHNRYFASITHYDAPEVIYLRGFELNKNATVFICSLCLCMVPFAFPCVLGNILVEQEFDIVKGIAVPYPHFRIQMFFKPVVCRNGESFPRRLNVRHSGKGKGSEFSSLVCKAAVNIPVSVLVKKNPVWEEGVFFGSSAPFFI